MEKVVRTVVEIDRFVLDELIDNSRKVLRVLQEDGRLPSKKSDDWILLEEFGKRTRTARWKHDQLRMLTDFRWKKIGRKIYVHPGEVDRYFAGELNIS